MKDVTARQRTKDENVMACCSWCGIEHEGGPEYCRAAAKAAEHVEPAPSLPTPDAPTHAAPPDEPPQETEK